MKTLIINASPRKGGNTSSMLDVITKILNKEGIETEVVQIGQESIRGCMACYKCKELDKCVIDDCVNELADKLIAADGFILASPVYYGGINGTLKSALDRIFFRGIDCGGKVSAAIAVCRRGGNETALDQMNKYLFYSRSIIVGSQYWSGAFGLNSGQVTEDVEGMEIMKTLAENFAFAMKSVALGKEKYGVPKQGEIHRMNFIR